MTDQLKGKRTALKGWVTRLTKQLTDLCDLDSDTDTLTDCLSQLTTKLKTLDTVQAEIEGLLPTSEMEADVEEAFQFNQKASQVKIRVNSLLKCREQKVSKGEKGVVPQESGAKLPKIELPRFGGNILEWCSFQEQFDAVIHNNPQIKPLTKFSYLRSLLHGDALNCIRGFSLTEANYTLARDLLIER